jgi:hypothetical protein
MGINGVLLMFYAQITNGIVTGITETTDTLLESTDLVEIGFYNTDLLNQVYDGTHFYSPAITSNPVPAIDFKLRFTAQERIAIYASTDDFVIDFRQLLDDPRLQNVDVLLPTTIDAIDYLIALSLLDASRKDEILA